MAIASFDTTLGDVLSIYESREFARRHPEMMTPQSIDPVLLAAQNEVILEVRRRVRAMEPRDARVQWPNRLVPKRQRVQIGVYADRCTIDDELRGDVLAGTTDVYATCRRETLRDNCCGRDKDGTRSTRREKIRRQSGTRSSVRAKLRGYALAADA